MCTVNFVYNIQVGMACTVPSQHESYYSKGKNRRSGVSVGWNRHQSTPEMEFIQPPTRCDNFAKIEANVDDKSLKNFMVTERKK